MEVNGVAGRHFAWNGQEWDMTSSTLRHRSDDGKMSKEARTLNIEKSLHVLSRLDMYVHAMLMTFSFEELKS